MAAPKDFDDLIARVRAAEAADEKLRIVRITAPAKVLGENPPTSVTLALGRPVIDVAPDIAFTTADGTVKAVA